VCWADPAQACAGEHRGGYVVKHPSTLHSGFKSRIACETAAEKFRGPIPIPRNVLAAWQDVMCIRLDPNVSVNQMTAPVPEPERGGRR
jgi:hypothetical protein